MNDQNNNPYGNMFPYHTTQQQPYQGQQQPQYPQQGVPQYPMQQPYLEHLMQVVGTVGTPNVMPGMIQQYQAPQPPMLQSIPQYFRPDEQAMLQSYQQARMDLNSGSGYKFVKFLGPNGEDKWSGVPINYTAIIRAMLLPPWAQGKHIFAISKSHFWKSATKPQGGSIACPGSQTCKICQAKVQALDSGNAVLQKKAKDFGRVRTQYFYQVALLDNIQAHIENNMAPYILGAGANLHSDIGNLIEDKSISIFDPQNGRPLRLKKTKTGNGIMDVEYKVTDEDPSPLPQVLWALLNNLIDLEKVNKMPTDQEMMEAVQDMGLVLSPYGGPNPYEMQVPPTTGFNQGWVPPVNQYNPMSNIPPMMPPQQPVNPAMPNMVQPMQPQQPMGPPSLTPPPVTSNSSGQGYTAQPSQQQQQTPQQPNHGFIRQPIQNTQQQTQQVQEQPQNQQTPQTLEQLQQSIKGNK